MKVRRVCTRVRIGADGFGLAEQNVYVIVGETNRVIPLQVLGRSTGGVEETVKIVIVNCDAQRSYELHIHEPRQRSPHWVAGEPCAPLSQISVFRKQ